MITIGLFGAFLAGVLSLVSPCSALLVPAFFAYAFAGLRQLVTKTAVFLLGLVAVLVPIGTGLGGLGSLVTTYRSELILAGGVVLIALGVYAMLGGGFRLPGMAGLQAKARGTGFLGVFALGAVYGFAGFCAGPLLGSVLTTAAVSGSALYGAAIMAIYALGMAVPLFVLAALWDRFDIGNRQWLRGKEVRLGPVKTNTLQLLSGGLFVVVGVVFLASHGTGALHGPLDTDQAFGIENAAREISARVSDGLVWLIGGILAVAGGAWWLSRRTSRK